MAATAATVFTVTPLAGVDLDAKSSTLNFAAMTPAHDTAVVRRPVPVPDDSVRKAFKAARHADIQVHIEDFISIGPRHFRREQKNLLPPTRKVWIMENSRHAIRQALRIVSQTPMALLFIQVTSDAVMEIEDVFGAVFIAHADGDNVDHFWGISHHTMIS